MADNKQGRADGMQGIADQMEGMEKRRGKRLSTLEDMMDLLETKAHAKARREFADDFS
jgi:hypothetical protein